MKIPKRIPFSQSEKKHTVAVEAVICRDLLAALTRIKTDFGKSDDLVVNLLPITENPCLRCGIVYIKTLVNTDTINSISEEIAIVKQENRKTPGALQASIRACFSGVRDVKEGNKVMDLHMELLSGNVVVLVDGFAGYLSIPAESLQGRAVEEPSSQTVVRGPKEAFTEKLNCNIMLVRKRIKSNSLKLENFSLGKLTKTSVSLMYIQNIAKDAIVQEIRDRIKTIDTGAILEGSYIEEWIKEDRYSLFPVFLSTEKPDAVAAALTEGKVAIFTDGTPYVLTAPAVMVEFLHSSEDFYHHFIISSMMRFLRFVAFFLTLLVPAVYIAITTFHQEIIPTPLLISIAAQREGVPFPAFFEALLMESTFEVLREAGIRMPRAIGSAISIVGALVLGQAAVEAGIISAVMVIIVSITAIASFAIPNYEMSNAIRTIRFIYMALAGVMGLYGVFIGLIILTLHLCKIKSVGIPYLTPIAPLVKEGNKDTIVRFPLWSMKNRPFGIHGPDKRKTGGTHIMRKNRRNAPEFRR